MRKFYLINALMLLLTLFSSAGISAAVTTYPYSPDFKSDDGWTKTTTGKGSWSRSSGYWQAKITIGDSKAYLFSPELQTKSGSRYTFTYTFKVGRTRYPNEKFTVYILKSATATSQQLYYNQSPTVSFLIQKTAVRFISAYTTGQMVQAHTCLTSHHSKLKSRFLKQSQTW